MSEDKSQRVLTPVETKKQKHQLRWLEQWDLSNILLSHLELSSSSSAVSLPLVDVVVSPTLRIGLSTSYNSHAALTNGPTGNGWGIQNDLEYIALDHKGSIFSKDEEFHLMSHGQTFTFKRSTQGIYVIEGEDDVKIHYDRANQRWIIESPNVRSVYGHPENEDQLSDSFQWSLRWEHWRGPGLDENSLQREVIAWYLVTREENHGYKTKLYYEYTQEEKQLQRNPIGYTSVVLLKSIRDSKNNFRFDLIYGRKSNEEFISKEYMNVDGIMEFPVPLLSKYFLQSYLLKTPAFTQEIRFDYNVVNNQKNRLLTGLTQTFASLNETLFNEPLLYFEYEQNENLHLLRKISIPSHNSTVAYSYNKLKILPLKFKTESLNTYRYPATDNVQIQQGVNYGVMSFDLGIGDVFLRIFNRHFTQYRQEISTCLQTRRHANYLFLEPEDPNGIKQFASILFPSMFAVLMETKNRKTLHIFRKAFNETNFPDCPTSTFNFNSKTLFRYSDSMMVISENIPDRKEDLFLIVPNEDDEESRKGKVDKGFTTTTVKLPENQNRDITRIIIQGDIILAYNGQQLYGIRKTENEQWETNIIAEVQSNEYSILNSNFHVPEDFKESILPQIQTAGLHMVGNMVLLSAITYDYSSLVTASNLYLLDDALRAQRSLQYTVKKEYVSGMTFRDEQTDGNIFHFGYNASEKHVTILKNISGKLDEELQEAYPDNPEKRREAKDEIIEGINKDNGHLFKDMVLFDPMPFVKFNLDSKKGTASNTTFEMMGNGWQTKQVSNSSSFLLGTSFVMKFVENEKDSNVAYQIYRQNPSTGGATGNILSNFKISNNFGNLAYGYPGYVGVHSIATDPVYLLTLPEEGHSCQNLTIGDRGEQLLRMSNTENIYTIRNSTDPSLFPFDKELIVRRVNSILSSSTLWTVSKTEIRFGTEIRTRTFENVFVSNDTTISQTNILRVTPMGNASLFGFYEEKTEVPIEAPENSTSTQLWYDTSGAVVLSKQDPETPEDVPSDDKWYKIFDAYGQKEIVDVSPYNISEKVVSHFGFEKYENNTHPWRFNAERILPNLFSLTGRNILRLQDTDRLQAVVTPTRQHELIIASTWVRLTQELSMHNDSLYTYGNPASFFTAKLKTHNGHELTTISSQMKRQRGLWTYLELLIDLEGIRQNAYAELYRHSEEYEDLTPPSQTNFTIVLEINRGSNDFVDVDHIRFYPSQLDLSSKVYDPENGSETERILFDGEILRKLYDLYGREVAVLGENDYIDNFRSGTFSGTIVSTNQNIRQAVEQNMKTEIIFQPEGGIYETFDDYSKRTVWQIEGLNGENWTFSKGTMNHESNQSHQVSAKNPENLFDFGSSSVRFYVNLHSTNSELSISVQNLRHILTFTSPGILKIGDNCSTSSDLPAMGEIIMHIDKQTAFIWFDGVLIFDRRLNRECIPNSYNPTDTPWSEFSFHVTGPVTISQFLTLHRPKITVDFLNAWGDRTQVLQLINEDTVLVHETIYDELGRDAIKTKTVEIHRPNEFTSLLRYYPELVTNRYPSDSDSVFKTGRVIGLLTEIFPEDEGFPYFRTVYQNDMLRDVAVETMPGKSFSADGSFAKRKGRHSGFPFLEILFPHSNGFRQRVEYEPNGSVKVTVIDTNDYEVAKYVKVLGHQDTLVITEYDDDGNVLKLLPPNYHKVMGTLINRTVPWNFGDDNLTPEEKHWQNLLGTHSKYKNKKMVQKKSPDIGTQGYMYDITGKMKFMYRVNVTTNEFGNNTEIAQDIIYMLNDESPYPVTTGFINDQLMIDFLNKYANDTSLPSKGTIYQRVIDSETHLDPSLRRKVRLILTYDKLDDNNMNSAIQPPTQEILTFSANNHVVMKTTNSLRTGAPTSFRKHYKRNMLKEISYPNESEGLYNEGSFNLIQSHDKLGRVLGVGTRQNATKFASFKYNSVGQVVEEVVDGVSRNLIYNSPGLLTKISDNYIAQHLTFTEGGYGQDGFGDGIVMSNILNASWAEISKMDEEQRSWFSIPKESFETDITMAMCIKALTRKGYIDEQTLIPKKFVTHNVISRLPLSCSGSLGHQLMKLVAKYFPPSTKYGHNYTYGNHQELTKAKFVTDSCEDTNVGPLQLKSFSELGLELAEKIWDSLVEKNYILMRSNNPNDKTVAVGKEGSKPIFRLSQLQNDLLDVAAESGPFTKQIMNYLYEEVFLSQSGTPTVENFQELYIEWWGYLDTPNVPIIIKNRKKQEAVTIFNMLQQKGYLSNNLDSLLSQEYLQLLEDLEVDKVKTTDILTKHFRSQLGLNVYDYESYSIDPNGNQQVYYVGLNKHEIHYVDNTNKVSRLVVQDPYEVPGQDETTYKFTHDCNGNVNSAEHRGILKIKYHPISNRPTFIEMHDGRRIIYKYDSQAERILKRVFNSNLTLISELRYVRDEKGLVLLDKQTTFDPLTGKKTNEETTTYIYGPRKSILGFIRNCKFYTVFTDHAGSTRLITHNGRVVAGYDYWPYGEVMKAFGEAGSQIRYRFTGQEFDEETGLYNYHARLYDPLICRFLQPDPKSQYYSPYVYGANTPVSLVDPDGEFFLELFMIIGFFVGAYLAAASANNNFNPLKWNWKNLNTYVALLSGGLVGAMLPVGFSALAASIGVIPTVFVGILGSYVKLAIDNKSWDSETWEYGTPKFWNSFFEGFSYGINTLTMGAHNVIALSKTFKTLGILGRITLVGASLTAGTGYAFLKGAFYVRSTGQKNPFEFWRWDFSDPAVLQSIFDGFGMGLGFVKNTIELAKFVKLQAGGLNDMMKDLSSGNKEFVKDILKENSALITKNVLKGIITVTAGIVFTLYGSRVNDQIVWDWKTLSTYENFVNNLFTGYALANLFNIRVKQPKQSLEESFTTRNDIISYWFTRIGSSDFSTRSSIKRKREEEYLKHLIEGFLGGSTFITNVSNNISNFIDCDKSGSENGRVEFVECQAFLGTGIKSRQNQEIISHFFKPSSIYQSKLTFVPIKPTHKPVELGEKLLSLFQENHFDKSFIQSFFIGSVYHSFENLQQRRTYSTVKSMHYCLDSTSNTNISMIHTSILAEDQQSLNLRTRTILVTTPEKFGLIKNQLVNNIKTLRFECMLDSFEPEGLQIQSEFLAVILSPDKIEMNIFTPNFTASTDLCSSEHIKFTEMPKNASLSEQVFRIFDSKTSSVERKNRLESLLNITSASFKTLQKEFRIQGFYAPSMVGFMQGIFTSNFKETFQLIMQPTLHANISDNLLVLNKLNSAGQPVQNSVPVILNFIHGTNMPKDDSSMYAASSMSASQEVLTATISTQDEISTTLSYEAVPIYPGIFNKVFLRDENDLQILLKYIYFTHKNFAFAKDVKTQKAENFRFISSFILGELLSRIDNPKFELHLLVPMVPEDLQRLTSQRFIFMRNLESNRCSILNIIESSTCTESSCKFDPSVPMDIPAIPEVDMAFLQMIEIHLNPKSIKGWTLETAPAHTEYEETFFQGVKIRTLDFSRVPKDSARFVKLESSREVFNFEKFSFKNDFLSKLLDVLQAKKLHEIITNENDFRLLFLGLMKGASNQVTPDVDGLGITLLNFAAYKHSTELTPELTALSLLSTVKDQNVIPQSEQVLVSNFKLTNIPEEITEKLNKSLDQLQDFQCSQEEAREKGLGFTKVPAVYYTGDIIETSEISRLTFQIDEEPQLGFNCSVPENPFLNYFRKDTNQPNMYSSAKVHRFADQMEAPVFNQNTRLVDCLPGAWLDGQYSHDGITCKSGKSKVAVFRKIAMEDVVPLASASNPFSLLADNYDMLKCTSLEFNSIPSVACEGDKSYLIYSPFNPPRLFDELDGNLMLGRVAINMLGKAWSFVKGKWGGNRNFNDMTHLVSEDMLDLWQHDITEIHNLLGTWEGKGEEMVWAKTQLGELETELEEIKMSGFNTKVDKIEEIGERVEALKEDLAEQILQEQTSKLLTYGKEKCDNDRSANYVRVDKDEMAENQNVYYAASGVPNHIQSIFNRHDIE